MAIRALGVILALGGGAFASDLVEAKVEAASMRQWVSHLSSDEMGGRANGSAELDRAADWLAQRFREIGLKPAPGQNGFFQPFEFKDRQGASYAVKNVIGWMEGGDPKLKDEYIMLSAHYDHVGRSDQPVDGDGVFNGADDDASGVAMVMGIVATLDKLRATPGFALKRSVMAVAWAGEEMGLKGSQHYAKNPWLPLEKLAVNLNFEMVGHSTNSGPGNFWMTGASFSDLRELVAKLSRQYGLTLIDEPMPDQNFFFRSDNRSFALLEFDRSARTAVGVPAHSFCTWGGEEHYHQLHDEADLLDYENMASMARLFAAVTMALANRQERPVWTNKEGNMFQFSRPGEKP